MAFSDEDACDTMGFRPGRTADLSGASLGRESGEEGSQVSLGCANTLARGNPRICGSHWGWRDRAAKY